MKGARYKPVGWRNESQRHSLAAKGISSNYYSTKGKYLAPDFGGDTEKEKLRNLQLASVPEKSLKVITLPDGSGKLFDPDTDEFLLGYSFDSPEDARSFLKDAKLKEYFADKDIRMWKNVGRNLPHELAKGHMVGVVSLEATGEGEFENIYQENGFKNRREYLENLAEENEVDKETVFALAGALGPDEDFDGLVTSIQDIGEGYFAKKQSKKEDTKKTIRVPDGSSIRGMSAIARAEAAYQKNEGFTNPVAVLKLREDPQSGEERAMLQHKGDYYVHYGQGTMTQPLKYDEAVKTFNKYTDGWEDVE